MNLRPLGDRVVVKREVEEEKRGALYIPDNAKEKPQRGTVLAVGPGELLENGTRMAIDLKKGDRIIFGKYAGGDFDVADETIVIVREREILAILED